MGCKCGSGPTVSFDVPHPHHRVNRKVACLYPERPIDHQTIWDVECSACMRHADVSVASGFDPLCHVYVPDHQPYEHLSTVLKRQGAAR